MAPKPKPVIKVPTEVKKQVPLVCQWQSRMYSDGVSMIFEGNPTRKSVKELIDTGIVFEHKQEISLKCQRQTVSKPKPKPKPQGTLQIVLK